LLVVWRCNAGLAKGAPNVNPISLFLAAITALAGVFLGVTMNPFIAGPFVVVAVIIVLSLKMANAWHNCGDTALNPFVQTQKRPDRAAPASRSRLD